MANRMAREFRRLVEMLEQIGVDVIEEGKKALELESHRIVRDAENLTPVNTGNLKGTWYTNRIKRVADGWEKEVGNSAKYASEIEFGFRSHFVPGYWVGNSFVYDRNAGKGMYVGPKDGYVQAEEAKRATKGK